MFSGFSLGIDGLDSSTFLKNFCQDEKLVLGWIHSHVMGTPVGFSSVDCHTQYFFDKFMYPGIKGFVVEIPSCKIDCFVLSDFGESQVANCSRKSSYSSGQFHPECSESNLYLSVFADIIFSQEAVFRIFDQRDAQPLFLTAFESGQHFQSSVVTEKPAFSPSLEVPKTCSMCLKTFRTQSLLARHKKRSKCGACPSTKHNVDPTISGDALVCYLSQPCVSCGTVFTDQKSAKNHFARSTCKNQYIVFNQWIRSQSKKTASKNCEKIKMKNHLYYARTKESRRDLYLAVLRSRMQTKYKNELAYKLKRRYHENFRMKLRMKYTEVLKSRLAEKYEGTLKSKLKEKYSTGLKHQLAVKYTETLRTKLKEKYSGTLKTKLKEKYSGTLKTKLKQKYSEDLKHQLAAKYKLTLEEKMKQKYKNELKMKMREKYNQILKQKLAEKYKGHLKTKLKKKYNLILRPQLERKYRTVLKPRLQRKHLRGMNQKVRGDATEENSTFCELEHLKLTFASQLLLFRNQMLPGLVFDCFSCERVLFEDGVRKWSSTDDGALRSDLKLMKSTPEATVNVCWACAKSLKNDKLPAMSTKNN